MLPIPDVDKIDATFGNIDHMPKFDKLPAEFKNYHARDNKYQNFIEHWFYQGIDADKMQLLTPKEGVDQTKALAAIRAVLCSFAPKHEHKICGCAYMLSQWFDIGKV